MTALLVLALTAGLAAWQQSRAGEQQRQAADSARKVALPRQFAAQSDALIGTDSDLAALLAVPLRHRLVGHRGSVLSVAFRSDGRMVSAADDGTVRLGDPRTGRLRETFADSAYGATVFTPDGRTLATSSLGRGVELWDTA